MSAETPNRRMLRLPAVLDRTGLRPTALHDAIARGEFPAPIPLTDSGRAVAWLEAEIDDWQDARITARDAKAKRKK